MSLSSVRLHNRSREPNVNIQDAYAYKLGHGSPRDTHVIEMVLKFFWRCEMPTWLFVTIMVGLIALGIFASMQVSAHRRAQSNILLQLNNVPGFSPSQTLLKTDFISSVCFGLSIDATSNQLCLILNQPGKLMPFSSIRDAEVLVDGHIKVNAVGISFGALSVGEAKATTKIKSVVLRVLINDPSMPRFDIPFIEMGHMGPSDGNAAIAEAEYWRDTVKAVVGSAQNNEVRFT